MSRLTLYQHVKEKLLQALASGEWTVGDRIPVERELAARFKVGISTVRAAVSELEAAGLLWRKQGKGTFVSERASRDRLFRFFNLTRLDGTREIPVRRFVSLSLEPATQAEADLLQLWRYNGETRVHRLRTTFSLQGRVIGVADSILPADLMPGLTQADVVDGSITLYVLYQSRYNVNVTSVSADLCAEPAPEDVAHLLAIEGGHPLLRVDRKAFTDSDIPIELRVSWLNTAHCRFHLEQGSTV